MVNIKALALSLVPLIILAVPARAEKAILENSGRVQAAAPQDADLAQRLQKIDAIVTERMKDLNLPAYCLTIIKSGEVVHHKAYGYADVEKRQSATTDTIFGIGSLTKTFTALILLMLVDEGIVKLDAPLSQYVPDLTKPYQSLTIRQLATMTAGVPATVSREVPWTNQLKILEHTPLTSTPGSQYLYSNFSYRLLGSVISNVTSSDYLEVLKEIILKNFEMKSTATTTLLADTGRVAQAYSDDQGKAALRPVAYKNPAITYASGMLASTAHDLAIYVLALLSGEIISEQGYRTMWYDRPPLSNGKPSRWAFGWWSTTPAYLNGQQCISMTGGIPGVASSIIMIPKTDCAVIALCNLRKPEVYEMARSAAKIAFGDDKVQPREHEEVETESAEK